MIDLIAVDVRFQGHGVARDMIRFAESSNPDFESIQAGTQSINTPSINFYQKTGFRQIASASAYVLHAHFGES